MTNPLEIVQAFNGIDDISLRVNASRLKALAWARVSTEMQDAKGHSIPEQLKQIREYAENNDIEIAAEYSEAASAYQSRSKRLEFVKMLQHAQDDPDISIILIHDFSRFSRDSTKAKTLVRELKDQGIRIISLNDPEFDTDTVAGVYMEAITYAKNEAYSKEVAFHTRKGCKANVNARDDETGWGYKNGGTPMWGYKSVRLERGFERKGIPIIKAIWNLDDSIVEGRPVHEWAKYCLVELAMKGASLAEIRDFCNEQGLPARRSKHWSFSTWKSLLSLPAIMQYSGYGLWNVRRKNGSYKPYDEWEIVENAHPAIITTDEAKAILDVRKEQSKSKSFGKSHKRLRNSPYLLSGGLSKCGRCGSNLVGFKKDRNHAYYVCGSIQYRKGKGCGPGVYIPQMELEEEVINGLEEMMSKFTVSDGFEDKINNEIKRIWENETGVTSHVEKELREVEIKLKNIYDAIENGFHADTALLERSQKLQVRKDELENICRLKLNPPSIDSNAVREYVTDLRRVINSKNAVESRKLLRMSVEGIMFDPEALEVMINYKIPESVGFKMVAGGGFEPPTFGL